MTERRLQGVMAAALILSAVLVVQLLRLQLIDPAVPPRLSDGRYPRVVEAEPPRGLITDRAGRVLATNVASYDLVVVPGDLPEGPVQRGAALQSIATAAELSIERLVALTSEGLAAIDPLAPVVIRTGIERERAVLLRVRLASVPAVQLRVAPRRVYEGGDLFAHVLGHVGAIPADEARAYLDDGYALNATVGLSGIERQYEDVLRGEPERRLILSSAAGRELQVLGDEAAVPGRTLVLALDRELQAATANALERGIQAGLAALPAGSASDEQPLLEAGAAVMMDVHTGELLALVSRPSFDVGVLASDADVEQLRSVLTDPEQPMVDRSFMEARSPGSTFKPLVALAALEEGIATADTRITSYGALHVRDRFNPSVVYTFGDWTAHGTLDLAGGIARSSDVYFYYLAGGFHEAGGASFDGLGPERVASYARMSGLGAPTGLDLPGETSGLVPDPDWKREAIGEPWYLGDTYTFGIGQGYLTATPLQMAVMTAAIANGGEVLVPRVVRATIADGREERIEPRTASRLQVSAEALEVVRDAMRQAASRTGTAYTGQPAGMSIGGKTGTAEFGRRLPNGEYPTHGWYIAFAPFDEPEIAIAVFLRHGGGSQNAGPVAREMLEAYRTWRDGGSTVGTRP